MKLSRNTWHGRNWEAWVRRSESKKAAPFQKQFFAYVWRDDSPEEMAERRGIDLDNFIVEPMDDYARCHVIWEPPVRTQPNLCLYFWVAVLRGAFWRAAAWADRHPATAVIIGLSAIILVLGTLINTIGEPAQSWWFTYAALVGIVVGLFLVGLATIGIGGVIVDYVNPWIRKKRQQRTNKPIVEKGPNLFAEQLKAKKQKVCPLIELVDE